MAGKMLRSDAEEVLRSLQMVGEGWYIQVGQWIKAGAHKALDMDEREFAQSIGQRLRDPRDAIVEMHDHGHSESRIARVLGVDRDTTVHNALVDAGRKEGERRSRQDRKALTGRPPADSSGETGRPPADSDAIAKANEEARKAQAEAEALAEAVAAAKAEAKKETARLAAEKEGTEEALRRYKEATGPLAALRAEAIRLAEDEANGIVDEKDRQRHRKAAEAWADAEGEKAKQAMLRMEAGYVVASINEATEDLAKLIAAGLSSDSMDEIERAHASLTEQITIARMSVRADAKEDM